MAYVSDDTRTHATAEKKGNGFFTWLSAGFVSMMNHMHQQAAKRLPQMHEADNVDVSTSSKKQSVDKDPEDRWSGEMPERYASKGYISSEYYRYMYY